MGSDGVGDGEDERMVAIDECVSDGVVVGIDWLVVLVLVLVVVCLFVDCLLFARTSLSGDVA